MENPFFQEFVFLRASAPPRELRLSGSKTGNVHPHPRSFVDAGRGARNQRPCVKERLPFAPFRARFERRFVLLLPLDRPGFQSGTEATRLPCAVP